MVCIVGVVALFTPSLLSRMRADKNFEEEFQRQAKLARAEGIPLSASEIAAHIPVIPDTENAAPYYRQLVGLKFDSNRSVALSWQVNFRSSRPDIQSAEKFLASNTSILEPVERATLLPHCNFNRDWNEGYAILNREYAPIKSAAKMLLLRGAVAAAKNNSQLAILELRRTLQMSRHLSEEPSEISCLMGRAIRNLALTQLCYWAYRYRHVPEYPQELRSEIVRWSEPSFRWMHLTDATFDLQMLDWSKTPQGRKMIGIREDQIPAGAEAMLLLQSEAEGRLRVLEGERLCWKSYGAPKSEMDKLFDEGRGKIARGVLSFPAAQILTQFPDTPPSHIWGSTDKMTYQIVLQALETSQIPHRMDTSRFVSPLDNKPVRYKFDGKQMTIDFGKVADDDDRGRIFRLPPKEPSQSNSWNRRKI